ncbi:hypothetical protein M885DRAFT_613440 [Pelagophyceae sp. CCMP2097]|nr:hypothetical protein M885DRAFT_613440 [Pelagophyceae sp. CCMP2097]
MLRLFLVAAGANALSKAPASSRPRRGTDAQRASTACASAACASVACASAAPLAAASCAASTAFDFAAPCAAVPCATSTAFDFAGAPHDKRTQRFDFAGTPFHDKRTQRYAACARRAIDDGLLDKARSSYRYYLQRFTATAPASEAALLAHRWALLEQRAFNETGARLVFKLGARIVSSKLRDGQDDASLRANGATLFCSWALCEFRHASVLGHEQQARSTSLRLLEHAVKLDEAKANVLKWRRFQRDGPAQPPRGRGAKRPTDPQESHLSR